MLLGHKRSRQPAAGEEVGESHRQTASRGPGPEWQLQTAGMLGSLQRPM